MRKGWTRRRNVTSCVYRGKDEKGGDIRKNLALGLANWPGRNSFVGGQQKTTEWHLFAHSCWPLCKSSLQLQEEFWSWLGKSGIIQYPKPSCLAHRVHNYFSVKTMSNLKLFDPSIFFLTLLRYEHICNYIMYIRCAFQSVQVLWGCVKWVDIS